jgi:two-component system chemotaxis response regulator CheB
MKGRIVVIGASLSGIDALCRVVRRLPEDFPAPIFVAQHVASHSPGLLPQILSAAGPLPAVHPRHLQPIETGHIYVAPPDRHMLLKDGVILLSHGPKENLARPAIDPLFRSAALAYGERAIGVVLTGQLNDGTAGLLAIKDRGGTAIVQEPAEATAQSMPLSALRHVAVDHHCSVDNLGQLLTTLAADPPEPNASAVAPLLVIESRIAEGLFTVDDWWRLEQLSVPAGLNCPDCRSALYRLNDQRILRFRCRSGHGFSAECLLSGQSDARGNLLSSLFGALLEEATVARELLKREEYAGDDRANVLLRRASARLELQADEIWTWMRETAGLVAADPGDRGALPEESERVLHARSAKGTFAAGDASGR